MAGGKGATFSNALLALILNGTTITGLAQNVSSGALTTLYVALHTASPGASGNQSTSEAAYTGYARVGVVRTSSGWAVASAAAEPVAAITFPAATGGSETETYWSIGTAASGAGMILWFGPISPTIAVSSPIQPELSTASMVTEG